MKRKSIIYLSIYFLIIIVFFNCAKKPDKNTGRGEILFYTRFTPDEMTLWEESIKEFNKLYPDIKVKIENYPYAQYWPKLQTMIAAGVAPDVIFLESTRVPVFLEKDCLLPLNEFIKNGNLKETDFDDGVIDAYKKDGNIYGLPNDIAMYAMFYNKTLFDQRGVPYPKTGWTWDDFLQKAEKLTFGSKNDKVYGFAIGWTPMLWILQAGGDYFTDNKNPVKSAINSRESIKGFEFVMDLMYGRKVAPSVVEVQSLGNHQEMFKMGKVAMIIEGHWVVPSFEREIKNFEWDFVECPKGKRNAVFNFGSCFAIPKLAKNPVGAYKFIEFMAGEKGQLILLKGGFSTPVLKSSKVKQFFINRSQRNEKVFLDSIRYAKLLPFTPKFDELNNVMSEELDLLWLKKEPIQTVLNRLAVKMEKIVKE